jgi:hypothetical protein
MASTAERLMPNGPDDLLVIQARPLSSVQAWAVEERLPPGVVAVDVSHGGRFDPFTNKVKWGPYLDVVHRDLACRLVSTGSGEVSLSGEVSWDGLPPEPVTGESSRPVQTAGFTSWVLQTFGTQILGRPDASPRFDGDGDQIPLLAEYYFGLDPNVIDYPGMRLTFENPDRLLMTLKRRAAAADLEAGFFQSVDLGDWSAFDPGLPVSQIPDGDLETLTFDLGPLPPTLYIRLHLSE